jgi:hypothetical protein
MFLTICRNPLPMYMVTNQYLNPGRRERESGRERGEEADLLRRKILVEKEDGGRGTWVRLGGGGLSRCGVVLYIYISLPAGGQIRPLPPPPAAPSSFCRANYRCSRPARRADSGPGCPGGPPQTDPSCCRRRRRRGGRRWRWPAGPNAPARRPVPSADCSVPAAVAAPATTKRDATAAPPL